jgi:hypothetical protein
LFTTALAVPFVATSCGSATSSPKADNHGLAPPVLAASLGKTASGAPEAIVLTWTRDTSGHATGYYVYRDNAPIPDWSGSGNPPVALRVNGGNPVAQPDAGEHVVFEDTENLIVGTMYYYRVTVVDDQTPPTESDPSNQLNHQLHGQNVSGFSPAAVYWGDLLTITGDTFGDYVEASDQVRFPAYGGGHAYGLIDSWTDTEITVTVPDNTMTGPVAVQIGSTLAYSDEDLQVLNPYVEGLSPQPAFLGTELVVTGLNFGTTQGESKVWIGAVNCSAAVTGWSETEISLTLPEDVAAGNLWVTVDGHESNRVLFEPRVEILGAVPESVQSGEVVTLQGRFFGETEGQVLLDGETELVVIADSWSETSVDVELAATVGEHTLLLVTADSVESNEFSYTVVPDLTVEITGLVPGLVYAAGDSPLVGVNTAADAERVELYTDLEQLLATDDEAPFDGFILPVTSLSNGNHTLFLRAYRRGVIAESEPVDVTVYSLIGDVDADGMVGDSDETALAALMGTDENAPGFLPWHDPNEDGVVDETDLSLIGYRYGNTVDPLP